VLYRFYVIIGTMLYLLFRPLLPLFSRSRSRFGYLLGERFGFYSENGVEFSRFPKRRTIWFHAASVGEVRAVERLITELEQRDSFIFVLTVMTGQGHRLAEKLLAGRAYCLMAPLDIPVTVHRAVARICPDVFVCVETELWPVLLRGIKQAGVVSCLVNGRISKRSFARYWWIRKTIREIVAVFAGVAVICDLDRERFSALGVCEKRIIVSGNCKYSGFREKDFRLIEKYRNLFAIDDCTTVFVCGSVRSGEEKLLLPVYRALKKECSGRLVWIIAPRHLERIPDLEKFFAKFNLKTVLFSHCQQGGSKSDIVLVDSIGELADLYAIGDFNFCGGSLVDCGGHNIMEVIRWGLPVYFGPYMSDFKDAVDMVVLAGAGFQVKDSNNLLEIMSLHLHGKNGYGDACQDAIRLSRQNNRAASLQADLILQVLRSGDK
jgi:3-deoxy-D-manno-octulosonic-acid transferase